jgi:hypothetical protein
VQNFPTRNKNTDFIPLGKMFLLKIQTNPQEGFLIEREIILLMTQIGAYVQLDFDTNQQCSERASR